MKNRRKILLIVMEVLGILCIGAFIGIVVFIAITNRLCGTGDEGCFAFHKSVLVSSEITDIEAYLIEKYGSADEVAICQEYEQCEILAEGEVSMEVFPWTHIEYDVERQADDLSSPNLETYLSGSFNKGQCIAMDDLKGREPLYGVSYLEFQDPDFLALLEETFDTKISDQLKNHAINVLQQRDATLVLLCSNDVGRAVAVINIDGVYSQIFEVNEAEQRLVEYPAIFSAGSKILADYTSVPGYIVLGQFFQEGNYESWNMYMLNDDAAALDKIETCVRGKSDGEAVPELMCRREFINPIQN